MSTNKNSLIYSNFSPLVSRQPGMNGRLNTFESSDVSPNITQHKLDFESNNSSKYINNNNTNSLSPYQIAMMNTMFAHNHLKNLKFELGSPKKQYQNSTHATDLPFCEEILVENFKRKTREKKFTAQPKLITPIACMEDGEEDEKN